MCFRLYVEIGLRKVSMIIKFEFETIIYPHIAENERQFLFLKNLLYATVSVGRANTNIWYLAS